MNKKLELLKLMYGQEIENESPEFLDYIYSRVEPQEYNILDLHECDNDWFVDSPDGLVPVIKLISKGSYDIVNTKFTDGSSVDSSELHCFENMHEGWIAPINLIPGYQLKSKDGYKTVAEITNTGVQDLVFDLVVNHDGHRYYTNDISSHNSGAGKSLFLQNLGVNWAMAGLNVVYLSLELSEKLCAMRIDAMHTGYETREVMRNIDDVHMKIRASQQKSHGSLRIKQMPNGCSTNDIRAFIKEYEIHSTKKVDAILVDYLDLMSPMSKKISAENLFVKDKYVTEELRNLAVELNIVTVSASQLNRCLAPDTLVMIEGKGLIEIKDVVVGDKIQSETKFNTIMDKWTNTQHTYTIKTESGKEITCSANHRFPVENGIDTIENGMIVGDSLLSKGVDGIFKDKILSIKYFDEIDTVDITTDGDHLFFGNDILTHNTSYEETDFDPSHIAGGISKVNTADNVIGIFTSAAMKEGGRYQIQFMKTRSSAGVGSKVDLAFNTKSLRIHDLDDDADDAVTATSKGIFDQLKRNSVVRAGERADPKSEGITSFTQRESKVNPLEGAAALRAFMKKKT